MNIQISEKYKVVCEHINTRYGFKHEAKLFVNGFFEKKVKICYYNRTWEKYEFDSVLLELADKTGIKEIKEFVDNRTSDNGTDFLKTVGTIAKLGEIFCTDKKSKNDWKERILKAGLENKGLSIPEDWDQLSEEEKERRLNAAIKNIS